MNRTDPKSWPSWTVGGAELADLEALVGGWLRPLTGYRRTEPGERAATGGLDLALAATPDRPAGAGTRRRPAR